MLLEVPADLEHEVYRGLRIEAGLGVVEVVLLEVGAPEPCIGVVLVVEEVVDVETEIQRRRFLNSLRSVEMTGRAVISSEAERSPRKASQHMGDTTPPVSLRSTTSP